MTSLPRGTSPRTRVPPPVPATPPPPWERQPDDTVKQWRAFRMYRDAGPTRQLGAIARQLGVTGQLLSKWNVDHGWAARVWAFDMEEDRAWRRRVEAERAEVAKRHVTLIRMAQSKAIDRLRDLVPANMTATEALRYLTETMKLEQAIYGIAEEEPAAAVTVILDSRLVAPPTVIPADLDGPT